VIEAIGTYLPPWAGASATRVAGPDEDALTMAIAAGLEALKERVTGHAVARVVLVTRDLPLFVGGNAAVLLAGLGLPSDLDVVEQFGGAPAALDALCAAERATLVLGADSSGVAGAGAALVGGRGGALTQFGRAHRSLPLRAKGADAVVHADDDPRLQRERGVRASLDAIALDTKPLVIAGLPRREAAGYCEGEVPDLPTLGASAPFFALAALTDAAASGPVVAVEQATLSAATWEPGSVTVRRAEPQARELPARQLTPGPEIKIAFTAYDRAFDAKVGWRAGRCTSCGTLAFPPRHRCLGCGAEAAAELVALPRTGTVYTTTTVHVPVPALASPYSLAVVQLDDVDVRALVHVTDAPPGEVDIDDRGELVLRRVAVRSGVPDYGYAFSPEATA
jgi:uncharacterized OB-fold protein